MEIHHFMQACGRARVDASLATCVSPSALGQDVPGQSPFGVSPPRPSDGPSPSVPAVAETVPGSREAQLEERVRQLEAIVNRLSTQMQPGPSGGGSASVLPNMPRVPQPRRTPLRPPTPPPPAESLRRDSRCRRTRRHATGSTRPPRSRASRATVRFGPGFETPHGRRRVHLPVPQPDPVRIPGLPAGRPGPRPRHAS